ncbi:hypothetical protein [Deinococcus multiflagellatus]|uniref:Uncharacterized protein n=1 Tax=Deinococcus multiflagellatus TaxID=1656887 RepID=A0ABW1ZS83_9DEIO
MTFTGDLYNVVGSTYDPKHVPGHLGESWKALLISMGIAASSPCYVTNDPAPPDKSHPAFSVGGHMTVQSDGSVPNRTCFLMPLCSWHNSTSRDGIRFTHTLTQMLQLTGYMLGELAATFQLRLPSDAPYALLYYVESAQDWRFKDLYEHDVTAWAQTLADAGTPDLHVLIERVQAPDPQHIVRSVSLPGFNAPELARF